MSHFLEDLFRYGKTMSEPVEVMPGVNVIYKTLTPTQQMQSGEKIERWRNEDSRMVCMMVETLARSIYTINNMPLFLDEDALQNLEKDLGHKPSQSEQAALILSTKVERPVLEVLYAEYVEFYIVLVGKVNEIKKKLKETQTGSGTSTSAPTTESSPPPPSSST